MSIFKKTAKRSVEKQKPRNSRKTEITQSAANAAAPSTPRAAGGRFSVTTRFRMNDKGQPDEREGREAVVEIYGPIGIDWFTGEGNTMQSTAERLRAVEAAEADQITVKISSLGGDVAEALAIYHTLRGYGRKLTVECVGMVASAATIIAMAADRRIGDAATLLLLHRCSSCVEGNSNDLDEARQQMETIDQTMIGIYAERTGLKPEEVEDIMDCNGGRGRWMTAQEAVELGLLTNTLAIVSPLAMAASMRHPSMELFPGGEVLRAAGLPALDNETRGHAMLGLWHSYFSATFGPFLLSREDNEKEETTNDTNEEETTNDTNEEEEVNEKDEKDEKEGTTNDTNLANKENSDDSEDSDDSENSDDSDDSENSDNSENSDDSENSGNEEPELDESDEEEEEEEEPVTISLDELVELRRRLADALANIDELTNRLEAAAEANDASAALLAESNAERADLDRQLCAALDENERLTALLDSRPDTLAGSDHAATAHADSFGARYMNLQYVRDAVAQLDLSD